MKEQISSIFGGVHWVDLCFSDLLKKPVIAAIVASTIEKIPQLIAAKLKGTLFSNLQLDVLDRQVERQKRYHFFFVPLQLIKPRSFDSPSKAFMIWIKPEVQETIHNLIFTPT